VTRNAAVRDPVLFSQLRDLERRIRAAEGTLSRISRNDQIVLDHASLTNLQYAVSGHTGFASSGSVSSVASDLATHIADTDNPHATRREIEVYYTLVGAPSSSQYMSIGRVECNSDFGFPPETSGSIVGLSGIITCGAYTGPAFDVELQARKNGTSVWVGTANITGTGIFSIRQTQSVGVDTFNATSDTIQGYMNFPGGSPPATMGVMLLALRLSLDP